MDALTTAEIEAFADRVLEEDAALHDVTTQAVVPAAAQAHGAIVTREPLVIAGLNLAAAIFHTLDHTIKWTARKKDGDRVDAGTVIAEVSGPARPVLTGERPALNTLQHFSGIATLTRRFADEIADTGVVLLDTRKTVPGLRRFAKYAASVGGARNHRETLAEAILIKDNHIAVAGGLTKAVESVRAASDKPIEVECDTLEQMDEALALGVPHILLDNMSLADMRAAVKKAKGQASLEASGGVTLATVRGIAETGIDYISVGRLTQSAPAVDMGLDFDW